MEGRSSLRVTGIGPIAQEAFFLKFLRTKRYNAKDLAIVDSDVSCRGIAVKRSLASKS